MYQEQVSADEAHYQQRLMALLRTKMMQETPDAMQRGAHTKQHGLVRAVFAVRTDLPEPLRCGVFQPGAVYSAWVRFSNQSAPRRSDIRNDIRGAAIKLLDVPGDKLPMPDGNATSQDFVLISTPVFVSRDVREFCQLIQALVRGRAALAWHFLRYPRSFRNLWRASRRCDSPVNTRYWSATPYCLGPDSVVKYTLIPHADNPPAPAVEGYDYLKAALVRQLQTRDCVFDFCVQLRTQPQRMPVEDSGQRWSEWASPFIKVAELRIPAQVFDTPAQQQYGLSLSFNPWHARPEHRPLGGINRARRVIYDALSQFRHDHNGEVRQEPTDCAVPDLPEPTRTR